MEFSSEKEVKAPMYAYMIFAKHEHDMHSDMGYSVFVVANNSIEWYLWCGNPKRLAFDISRKKSWNQFSSFRNGMRSYLKIHTSANRDIVLGMRFVTVANCFKGSVNYA